MTTIERKELFRKINVMKAWADGKKIEMQLIQGDPRWIPVETPQWDWTIMNYRTAPEKRKVPLNAEDVLRLGIRWVRSNCEVPDRIVWSILLVTSSGVLLVRGGPVEEYFMLQQHFEYSTDGITWHKCEKEETV